MYTVYTKYTIVLFDEVRRILVLMSPRVGQVPEFYVYAYPISRLVLEFYVYPIYI
jgi:hypothetical protein